LFCLLLVAFRVCYVALSSAVGAFLVFRVDFPRSVYVVVRSLDFVRCCAIVILDSADLLITLGVRRITLRFHIRLRSFVRSLLRSFVYAFLVGSFSCCVLRSVLVDALLLLLLRCWILRCGSFRLFVVLFVVRWLPLCSVVRSLRCLVLLFGLFRSCCVALIWFVVLAFVLVLVTFWFSLLPRVRVAVGLRCSACLLRFLVLRLIRVAPLRSRLDWFVFVLRTFTFVVRIPWCILRLRCVLFILRFVPFVRLFLRFTPVVCIRGSCCGRFRSTFATFAVYVTLTRCGSRLIYVAVCSTCCVRCCVRCFVGWRSWCRFVPRSLPVLVGCLRFLCPFCRLDVLPRSCGSFLLRFCVYGFVVLSFCLPSWVVHRWFTWFFVVLRCSVGLFGCFAFVVARFTAFCCFLSFVWLPLRYVRFLVACCCLRLVTLRFLVALFRCCLLLFGLFVAFRCALVALFVYRVRVLRVFVTLSAPFDFRWLPLRCDSRLPCCCSLWILPLLVVVVVCSFPFLFWIALMLVSFLLFVSLLVFVILLRLRCCSCCLLFTLFGDALRCRCSI